MSSTSERRPLLAVNNVAVHFGGLVAISDMSFALREGELLSLIGPNGAGKTTAFNVVTGFLRPTKGTVHFKEVSLAEHSPHEIAAMGLVRTFQRTSLFTNETVFDNVLTGLHLQGKASFLETILALPSFRREERDLKEQVWEVLDFVGLKHRAKEQSGSLPYGEQRLLGVAIGLAARAKLLLLDEPAAGMNGPETTKFMDILQKIRDKITIVVGKALGAAGVALGSAATAPHKFAAWRGATLGLMGPRAAHAVAERSSLDSDRCAPWLKADDALREGLIDAVFEPGETRQWLGQMMTTLRCSSDRRI